METKTKSVADEVVELLARGKGEDLVSQDKTLLIEKNGQKYPLDE